MRSIWVVRAGEGNEAVEQFRDLGVVGYGDERMGDLRNLQTWERIKERVRDLYPDNPRACPVWAGQYWRILHDN